jgi:hypothetical protein
MVSGSNDDPGMNFLIGIEATPYPAGSLRQAKPKGEAIAFGLASRHCSTRSSGRRAAQR